MKFIGGLDISTNCSGWGLLPLTSSDLKKDGHWGKIVTAHNDMIPIEDYFEKVDKLLRLLKTEVIDPYGKDILSWGIEQPNHFRGGETTRQLCGVYGIVRKMFYDLEIPLNEINTGTAKAKFKTDSWVKGTPGKPDMVRFANERYGTNFQWLARDEASYKGKRFKVGRSDDDTVDGIAIAHALREEIGAELVSKLTGEE